MDVYLWGSLLRASQAVLEGAPTLLVGLVVAAAMRHLLGSEGTRRLFGGSQWRSLPVAWLIGMLLPVCSLGVIPVAQEMRRAGISGGTVFAFALTAPLFNPLSLLYGLTLASPTVILVFALCSLLLVTVIGKAWDQLDSGESPPTPTDITAESGVRRMAAILVTAARTTASSCLVYCLIGIAGTALLSILFPKGSLGNEFAHGDPKSPWLMLAIAPLAYATPLTVMMQIGSMFVHGNSVGAAYTLLTMGAGMNLGLIVWAWHQYGWKKTLAFLLLFAACVMGIAHLVEKPLYSAGEVDHPHTHAFDGYSSPFSPGDHHLSLRFQQELANSQQPFQTVSLQLVGLLLLGGIVLRLFDRDQRIESRLSRPAHAAATGRRLDVAIPGFALALIGLVGLFVLSVISCYIYYPPPQETLDDMRVVRADALSAAAAGDVQEATRHLDFYDELTRRLQVGYYLHHGSMNEQQQAKAKRLRDRLEQLKDNLRSTDKDRVRRLISRVLDAHQQLRETLVRET